MFLLASLVLACAGPDYALSSLDDDTLSAAGFQLGKDIIS